MLAKVVIELRFKRRIPRKVLEEIATSFDDMKASMVSLYKKHDKDVYAKVWYEDYSRHLMGSNPFLKLLKRKG